MAPLLLFALFFLPLEKPPEKCSLEGTVVDSVSGEPLNKVSFRLEAVGKEAAAATTTADDKGRFTLVDLEPGTYRLRGRRSGYLEMLYGARRPDASGTLITLEAGQALTGITFKLTPAGAIAGAVRDCDGEALESATVEIGRVVYSKRGRRRLERVRMVSSDDRGEYRFHGLPPGKYFVSAAEKQSNWFLGEVDRSGRASSQASVATYYPGATESSMASPIEVAPGARVGGIDIRLLRSRVACVTGRITNAPPGRVVVDVETPNSGMSNYRASTTAKSGAGDFRFCGVPSGSYVLSAYSENMWARAPLEVRAIDVNDVRLTLAAPPGIQGRISIEGEEKPDLKNFCIGANQDGRHMMSMCGPKEAAFAFRGLHPDHYDLEVTQVPAGYFVKSIRSGETDVTAEGLALSASGATVDIVLAPGGSRVSGVVINKDQQPVAGATVLFAPDQRSRADRFQSTTTDQRGRYELSALAPGDYKLFAWDDVEPNEWNDPEFLKKYESQGEKAALEPKSNATFTLRIAVAPDAQ